MRCNAFHRIHQRLRAEHIVILQYTDSICEVDAMLVEIDQGFSWIPLVAHNSLYVQMSYLSIAGDLLALCLDELTPAAEGPLVQFHVLGRHALTDDIQPLVGSVAQ